MLEKRLQALRIYESLDVPPWAPDISELDMDHIDTYIRPKTDRKARWEDLPQNIRDTFDRLGIPEAEKKSLAGVGAQYDSEVVYHNVQKELKEQGVIYVDFETAVKEYEDLIKPYFGQLITRITISLQRSIMRYGRAVLLFMCRKASMYVCRCKVISA